MTDSPSTPGIYQYSGTITINRPNTIVLGIGYPTIVPQTGTPAIEVADVDGVRYNVFRGLDPDFTPLPEAQLISGLSDTSYTDTGINPSTTYFYAVQAVSDSSASQLSNIVKATTPNSGGLISKDIVDINAGGGAIGEWDDDEDFTGGTATSTGAIVNTSLLPNAAPQSVYQTNRFGATTYKIPGLKAGQQYVVNLHFAETFWNTPGQRQFNVLINGQEVLKNFDIVATAGGQNVATIQSFIESADSSGSIKIQFAVGAADNPQINGIEIGMPCQANCPVAPDAPAKLTAKVVSQNQVNLAWATDATPAVTYTVFRSQEPEFRPTGANQIVSGLTGTSYSDTTANPATVYYYVVESFNSGGTSQTSNYVTATTPTAGGRITSDILNINAGGSDAGDWIADKYFTGGTATSTTAVVKTPHVAEPAPLSVYQTNRFGNFTYAIPGFTPGGSYIVDLHFAETFWTAPGLRQFNVLINGKQMLANYDIFASAGGEYLATVQSFAVTADNTGAITIQFVPASGDNPQVNGIEIGTGAVGHADPDR